MLLFLSVPLHGSTTAALVPAPRVPVCMPVGFMQETSYHANALSGDGRCSRTQSIASELVACTRSCISNCCCQSSLTILPLAQLQQPSEFVLTIQDPSCIPVSFFRLVSYASGGWVGLLRWNVISLVSDLSNRFTQLAAEFHRQVVLNQPHLAILLYLRATQVCPPWGSPSFWNTSVATLDQMLSFSKTVLPCTCKESHISG